MGPLWIVIGSSALYNDRLSLHVTAAPLGRQFSTETGEFGIVTMEDEYKVICALSNSSTFDDLE